MLLLHSEASVKAVAALHSLLLSVLLALASAFCCRCCSFLFKLVLVIHCATLRLTERKGNGSDTTPTTTYYCCYDYYYYYYYYYYRYAGSANLQ